MEVFLPDNFSASEIAYRPSSMSPEHVAEVLKYYLPDCSVTSVAELDAPAFHTDNFKVTCSAAGVEQTVLVRKYKTLAPEQINFYIGIISDLETKGVAVAHFLKTIDSQKYSIAINEGWYAVVDFIDAKHFSPTEDNFKNCARAIAGMHQALASLPPDVIDRIDQLSHEGYTYFNIIASYVPQDFLAIQELLTVRPELSAVDSLVLNNIGLCAELAQKLLARFPAMGTLPHQIIHSDLHPHNLLVDSAGKIIIIDFDGMRKSQRGRDIAFAIHRLGRQFFAAGGVEPSVASATRLRQIFLDSYRSRASITVAEEEQLGWLLRDEFLKKTLFVLRSVYLEGKETYRAELPKFFAALREIDYFWPPSL